MRRQDFDREWVEKSAEVLSGMKEWRLQHPRATLREIERETDKRLAGLRRRMIEDMVGASQAAEWGAAAEWEKPVCPECQKPLQQRGEGERGLQTQGGETLRLRRRYGVCPQCGAGLFPPG
jgi:RNase P subunit RPR2